MGNPVTPAVTTLFVTAGTTAPGTATQLPSGPGQQLIVAHWGATRAYILWGTVNTITAIGIAGSAARSYPIMPGTVQTITIGDATFISYISDAASQELSFTRGSGE